jgi:3-hydroxyisobutyrate dehydrogenase
MTAVAVLGTGIMGGAMARNLAKAGFEVRAWNRTRDKAEALTDAGVTVADRPVDAMADADFLVTMLADADAVAESVTRDEALAQAPDAMVWVQSSTVGVAGHDRLAKLAADAGVDYVDAPVLGTKGPAEAGSLIVLASGPDHVRDRCQPVLDAVGAKTLWLGDAGNGSRFKLVMNSWVLALTTATAEAMGLATAFGLDPKRFLDTIEGGPLDVPYAHVKGGAMCKREFPAAFPTWGALKDARLIVEAATDVGVQVKVAEAVAAQMQAAADAGHADEDMASVWHAVTAAIEPDGRSR